MSSIAPEVESRLATLRSDAVTDTPHTAALDQLTRLLAELCEVPIAAISLTDGEGHWFKSVHGVDPHALDGSASFSAHTVAQPGLFVVEDATTDPRFATDPVLAGEPLLRFYAGMPLVAPSGQALGALAVFDRQPRQLSALQAEALQALALQVMALLESRCQQRLLQDELLRRERAQAVLRDSEARWRELFEASATGIAACTLDGRIASANPALCELLGRSEAELQRSDVLSVTHPDDRALCQQQLRRLSAGEMPSFTLEKRYLRGDGSSVWGRATISLLPAARPEDTRLVAVVQDIDAQMATRQRLQQSHLLIGMAGRMARLGGWALDVGGDPPQALLHWSDELKAILEFPPDFQPSLNPALSQYPPDSLARVRRALDACLRDGTPFDLEAEIYTRQQRLLSVCVMGEAVRDASGRVVRAQGALLDLSEQRRIERTLRESEARFRNVARATADAIWDWNLADDSLWWSDGMYTLFGHDLRTLEPGIESWLTRIHPDDLERVHDSIHEVIDGGGERWSNEYRFKRRAGDYATVTNRGFVVRDGAGTAQRMVGGMTDVSRQHEADGRLRQQAALLEEAQDAIVVCDLEDRVTFWNRSAQRIFGWTADEAIGRRMPELLRQDAASAAAAHRALMAKGSWTATQVERHKNGHEVSVDCRWTLLRDDKGRASAMFGIKTDVTRRLELEAQLRQASRLEAVGQLTGGVAHDFNNLLTVILGNADLLADQLAEQPLLLPLAEMTRTAAERGAALTQRLLAFSRRQALQPQPVDIHQLLAGMDALLRRTLAEDIEIERVRAASLWPAQVDAGQLESAVLNLVLNARDAMPNGGRITLETGNAWIDQNYADQQAEVQPGPYVMLSVSDTGSGMSAAQLARAFEPFYTTKEVGKGSGLGLSMVYGFVKQSQGHVKLYSEPGHGTTARLYLPRAESAVPQPLVPAPAEQDLRGQATLLVVEDDALVRRQACTLLGGLGYQVHQAGNGHDALAILRERSDIALLFTDVVMPGGLNGRQLADAALLLRPQLKVLFTSGYTETAIVHHGLLDRDVRLLPKPYRSIDLARKVHAVLGGGDGGQP